MNIEQSKLRETYKQLLDKGYIVERTSKQSSQGYMEVGVRLLSKNLTPLTPIMYGLSNLKSNDLEECVNAEIAAITLCCDILGVQLNVVEETPIIPEKISIATPTPEAEASKITAYAIENEMGATVREVEAFLTALNIDLRAYTQYNKRLKNQGKRMTKKLMANFFCPIDAKANITFITKSKKETPPPVVSVENEAVFKAEL